MENENILLAITLTLGEKRENRSNNVNHYI